MAQIFHHRLLYNKKKAPHGALGKNSMNKIWIRVNLYLPVSLSHRRIYIMMKMISYEKTAQTPLCGVPCVLNKKDDHSGIKTSTCVINFIQSSFLGYAT